MCDPLHIVGDLFCRGGDPVGTRAFVFCDVLEDQTMTDAAKAAPPHSVNNPAWLAMLIAVTPALATIIGGVWTLTIYLNDKSVEESRIIQTRTIEAQKPVLEKQLALKVEGVVYGSVHAEKTLG